MEALPRIEEPAESSHRETELAFLGRGQGSQSLDMDMGMEVEEANSEQRKMSKRTKGGLITMPFIIANESFEKVASYGLLPNMILYLIQDYHLGVAKATNILFLWSAATNFLPVVGAFLSDSYLSRFLTIGLGSITSLSGMILLWLTAMIPTTKPPHCDLSTQSCKAPTASQFTLLYSSFALMSIGAGGIRPCSMAFGADQLDKRDNPKNERVLESFFSWYYASSALSVVIALTGIVYIQVHLGWRVGFGVPAILMVFATLLFFLASPFYIKHKASGHLFTGFVQVLVVAYKNRKLAFPPRNTNGWYHHSKDSKLVVPTDRLRFLNKACIIRRPERDINSDGSASNPWSLCTVDQVEELKALIKVIPIWSTGIMMSIVTASQTSFPVLQASSMDRHLSSSFEIPAGSFSMFLVIVLFLWVALYDRIILPLASKIRGKRVRLGVKQRMGIGLFLSGLAMVVAAIVENVRRRKAIRQGFLNNPQALVGMPAMWLVPQYCLLGLAEAFNAIGQTEFYYSEFPKSMSSIAAALFGLGMAVANLLATVIVSTVDRFTSRGGKESWVSNNINKGHFDNYYWVLAVMSAVNLLYYFVCSYCYGPCVEQGTKVSDEGKSMDGENELAKLSNGARDEVESLKDDEKLSKFKDEVEGLKDEEELSKLRQSPS